MRRKKSIIRKVLILLSLPIFFFIPDFLKVVYAVTWFAVLIFFWED